MRRTDHPHNTTAPGATPLIGLPSLHPCLANNQHEARNFVSFISPSFEACNVPGLQFYSPNYCILPISLRCLWCPFQQPNLEAPLKLWLHRAGQARPWARQPWQQSASWSWSSASSAGSASSASRITGAAAGHAWCTRCKHTA